MSRRPHRVDRRRMPAAGLLLLGLLGLGALLPALVGIAPGAGAAAPDTPAEAPARAPVTVGSKNFGESYLLAEMLAQLLEADGVPVRRRFGLGGTLICYEALRAGEIDAYVEYSGTLAQVILKRGHPETPGGFAGDLAPLDLELLGPLGFDNTYAVVVPEALAEARALRTIGDLSEHRDLRFAFSHEFREREDGWRGLKAAYDLPQEAAGIEHGLAYQAIADGRIDATDAYSTDGDIERFGLVTLADDRGYFPRYLAAPLVRAELPQAVRARLDALAGRLDESTMRALNAQIAIEGRSFADVASSFLSDAGFAVPERGAEAVDWAALGRHTLDHLRLTGVALGLAVLLGVGLGVAVHGNPRVSDAVLYATGLLQTIPSIALFALMIPLLGIGTVPAIVALFLYSLLPIVRNTITGLVTIDGELRKVALAMGFTSAQRMRYLFLPLALPSILAGVRTSAVICIGTATLAAFIGAGGLGEPIVTGLALNEPRLILQGAVPAAGLALGTELAFERLERAVVPAPLVRGRR